MPFVPFVGAVLTVLSALSVSRRPRGSWLEDIVSDSRQVESKNKSDVMAVMKQ